MYLQGLSKGLCEYKGRSYIDAIFDQGLWYVFYIGLILWLTASLALRPGYIKVGKIMTIAGARSNPYTG